MGKTIAICSALLMVMGMGRIQAQDRTRSQMQKETGELEVLLERSQWYINRTGNNDRDLDSALAYCRRSELLSNKLHSRSGKIRSLLLNSQICRKRRNYVQGAKIVEKALKLALDHHDVALRGEAYIEKSAYYDWGKGLQSKIDNLELALQAFRIKSTPRQLADLLSQLADQYFNIGNYTASISKGLEALNIYKAVGGGDFQSVYATLGISCTKLGLYEEGLRYSLLAAKIGEGMKDTSSEMMSIYNHIGLSAYYNKDYRLAKTYHEKFLELAIANKKTATIFFAMDNIVNDLGKGGKMQEAIMLVDTIEHRYPAEGEARILLLTSRVKLHTTLREFIEARKYTNRLAHDLKLHRAKIRNALLLNANQALISFYFATRDYNRAGEYLQDNKKIARISRDMAYRMDNLMWDFKIDSVAGKYVSAIKSQQEYIQLNDSLFKSTKAHQISNFHIQYETQKKDLEILENKKNIELLSKEGQLQKAKIENDRYIKLISGVALLLSLVIIRLIYSRYTAKKRKSEELGMQKNEIKTKNDALLKLVMEKEWLLKEVHHRVKNNLQIITGLLYAQSECLTEVSARRAIQNSHSRVQSMALLHRQLYRSENLSSVYMPGYINEFLDYLRDGYDLAGRIDFITDIENVEMEVSQAVPLGLILNEAVTNAIKHAYPGTQAGTIAISLKYLGDDFLEMAIQDNGPGMAGQPGLESDSTLGMTLMRGLGAELDGDLEIKNDNGFGVHLRFKYKNSVI